MTDAPATLTVLGGVITVLGGVIGGLVTLTGQYILGRFTESHKAKLVVASKRREWFYEKQAIAISVIYRRMDRCISDFSELYFHGDEAKLEPILSEAVEQQLTGKLDKAAKSFENLKAVYDRYNLFLPDTLDNPVLSYILLAEQHLDEFQIAFAKGFDELNEVVIRDIVELRSHGVTALSDLKKQFRELLTEDTSVKS